jgi:hypothetical protein
MKNKGTTIATEVKKKPKLYTYTWKIYNIYGYVKASNIRNATIISVKHYMNYFKKTDTLVRFDILVKKGKHEVY